MTAEKIVRSAGVVGLWRGNSAAMLRDMPYAAIVFATYAMYEETLCGALGRPLTAGGRRRLGGGLHGDLPHAARPPPRALRRRARTSRRRRRRRPPCAVRQIVSAGGPSAASALRPTLLGIVPYSGISFGVFEG